MTLWMTERLAADMTATYGPYDPDRPQEFDLGGMAAQLTAGDPDWEEADRNDEQAAWELAEKALALYVGGMDNLRAWDRAATTTRTENTL
jgi:hypothetical protein